MTTSKPSASTRAELKGFFQRGGYVRSATSPKRGQRGSQAYKKGYEVRLSARSAVELKQLRRALTQAGYTPGKPFQKGNQWRQPIYGRESVESFLSLVGSPGGRRPAASPATRTTTTRTTTARTTTARTTRQKAAPKAKAGAKSPSRTKSTARAKARPSPKARAAVKTRRKR